MYVLPLAINPTGCIRTEPKSKTLIKRSVLLSSHLSFFLFLCPLFSPLFLLLCPLFSPLSLLISLSLTLSFSLLTSVSSHLSLQSSSFVCLLLHVLNSDRSEGATDLLRT